MALLQDLRHGLRLLARAPGFTAAAVLTLALGIGANTALFSLVDALVYGAVAYRDPDRVAFVLDWDVQEQEQGFGISTADFLELQDTTTTLTLAGYRYWSANLTGGDQPERVQAYRVTGNTFDLLGVPALRGRTLTPGDTDPAAPAAVVISHGLWERRFGLDAGAIGREVELDGRTHTIVGVMPPEFEFPIFNFKGDAWAPLGLRIEDVTTSRADAGSIVAIARLNDGVDYAAAQVEIDTLMRRLEARFPETNTGVGARLVAMQSLDDQQAGPIVAIVGVTVGLILLLACVNVTSLLLARSLARRQELAVRAALGAGWGRLVRQLLTESAVLAVAGGGLALVGASWVLDAARASLPDLLLQTAPGIAGLGLDRRALVFTGAVTLLAAVVCGLAPALRAASSDLVTGLKDASRGTQGRQHHRLRSVLVAAEVALSVVVLVAAGLLVRSFQQLTRIELGFEPSNILTLTISLPDHRYGDDPAIRRFYDDVEQRVSALPGVRSAGLVNVLPFSTYNRRVSLLVEGEPSPRPGEEPSADYRVVSPGYFRTLQIPIRKGRPFDRTDDEGAVRVAALNETLATRLFGETNPLGRRVLLRTGPDTPTSHVIVGIVGDVRHSSIVGRPAPEIYVPYAQHPSAMMMAALHTESPPEALTGPARAAILDVDPEQAAYHVRTLESLVADARLPQASAASLMTMFGALALALAGVGLYGVLSFMVSQQRGEIGVRMALGASRQRVFREVVGRGLRVVGMGIVLGLAGAGVATQALGSLLVGVSPADALTYLGVLALLTATAFAACILPARRAMRVSPATALRSS